MPEIYWLKCKSDHWSRSEGIKGVRNCKQSGCTAAKVNHFQDVLEDDDFSVHKSPTATAVPSSIKDFKVASTDPYTKHQCGVPNAKDYPAILDQIGAANSIMRIASDACVEYMEKLKAADAVAFKDLLTHLNKGSGFFNNLARDVQMALLRESRGHVEVNMGYVEENVWLEYRSTQLSTYYVTQAGTNSAPRYAPYSARVHLNSAVRFELNSGTMYRLRRRPSSMRCVIGSPNVICSLSIQHRASAFLSSSTISQIVDFSRGYGLHI